MYKDNLMRDIYQIENYEENNPPDISIDEFLPLLELPIPYMLYPKIPGISLNQVFFNLSDYQMQNVALEIRQFLDFFHSPEFYRVFQSNFPQHLSFSQYRYFHFWEKKYEYIREKIYPILLNEEKSWLSHLFEDFLNHTEYFKFHPTITHNDFDSSNILISQDFAHISGIIDFEECAVGDLAVDLLFYREGKSFQEIIRRGSSSVKYDPYLEKRCNFLYYRTCIPYLEWGLKHERTSMINYGKRRLHFLMNKLYI
ncbi:MAG: aminoglycoside phosphotransferase family protein [Candidatus Lokiarchaeota archaeon]|nr:aminoglycoside phosphotransferase family protein [Candidatus Harpocratesius repetitus]